MGATREGTATSGSSLARAVSAGGMLISAMLCPPRNRADRYRLQTANGAASTPFSRTYACAVVSAVPTAFGTASRTRSAVDIGVPDSCLPWQADREGCAHRLPSAPYERCGRPITGAPGLSYPYARPEDGRHGRERRTEIARQPKGLLKDLFIRPPFSC